MTLSDDAEIIPVLVTAVRSAYEGAVPHLDSFYLWDLDEFREWAKEALATIRELRSCFPGSGNLRWRETAAQKYIQYRIAPLELKNMFLKRRASTILKDVRS